MEQIRLNLVTGARLTGYLHDPADEFIARGTRPCVVVFPGGGYEILASHEAEPVAMRFYTAGYQVFVLYYTVTGNGAQPPLGLRPLTDASAALLTIRENCRSWRVDPGRIAVCGFSAGGHLAASLGTLWNHESLRAVIDTKNGGNRPDAMVLSYPVISGTESAHVGSMDNLAGPDGDREQFSLHRKVSADTPPAFLWHTWDDETVPVENSLLFAGALRKQQVSCELHVFANGPHGMGLCEEPGRESPACAPWMDLCITWLEGVF